jgi:hypothetical protein
VFDCGPLGWGRIAAHGHADALAVTLSAGGRPLLVDPGTYAYHTSAAWRHYFRSTLAHNTVTLDGLDQSVSGGNFLWLRKATARTVEADLGAPDTVQRVLGEHDGYARLPDPAIHRRQVAFDPRSRRLEVTDTFACRAEHRGTLCWHFSDACAVRAAGDDTVVATAPGVRATLRVAGAAAPPRLVSGQEEPPLGWVSRRFDERVPATVALWDCSVNAATKLVTIIEVGFLSTDPSNDR